MKTEKKTGLFRWIGSLGMFVVAGALFGCASTGYDKGDAAARSLQNTAAEIQAESQALDATLAALKDLINRPAADLKVQFRVYEGALDRLQDTTDRADSTGRRMRAKNQAYFEAWDKQLAEMNYEHIRKNSEARKAEVATQFDAVDKRYDEMQSALVPLVAYLQDIRKALNADLTREGLESVKPIVAKADENAARVQTALAKLATDFNVSSTRLSSVAVQAPAPPPAGGAEVRTDATTQ